jgi:hypothetical protein
MEAFGNDRLLEVWEHTDLIDEPCPSNYEIDAPSRGLYIYMGMLLLCLEV